MKKSNIVLLYVLLVSTFVFCGCAKTAAPTEAPTAEAPAADTSTDPAQTEASFSKDNPVTIKIGASPAPHAEILKAAEPALLEKGIKLDIVEFTDYVLPNTALEDGSLDANYFQHQPYLTDFNKKYSEQNANWTNLISLVALHFEPMGIYGGKTSKLADVADGAKIAVPNDATNEARALLLLEAQGLLKIEEGKGLDATKKDIADNPHNIDIVEVEAAQVPRSLQDVDFAVINGNYAIEAGLTADQMLAQEGTDSEAAQLYANIIAVREGDETRPELVALAEGLQCQEVKDFMEKTYGGSVVPMFTLK